MHLQREMSDRVQKKDQKNISRRVQLFSLKYLNPYSSIESSSKGRSRSTRLTFSFVL